VSTSVGRKLGPYEIIAAIGAGGMGEVYRARDPRIGREVAIKLLPAGFAADGDRLQRFRQEAQAAGLLNHPNLLTIYELGSDEGVQYIVSELLEGTTLRDRLPIPQRKAVEFALQIAAGLSAAHERGIVHRDLKPENVFVTADERVKLLDFGLAKFVADASGESQTAKRLTDPGVVMGTTSYMSPEQVRGSTIDHRSDVFSFGTVLLEMLSGSHPFYRGSQIDTMNAIVNDDPAGIGSAIGPALERIVRHALEKNPSQRFQSMKDAAFALETFSGSGEISVPARSRERRKREKKQQQPHFTAVTFRRGFVMTARFARDGTVVYGAAWEDKPLELFGSIPGDPHARTLGLADADVLSVNPVSGELAVSLGRHFSGGWVTLGTLARLPVTGGAPRELVENMQDADWSADGKSLAIIRRSEDLFSIEFPVGRTIYTTPHWISHVRLSPRSDQVAFLDHPQWGDDAGSVTVIDLQGKKVLQSRFFRTTSGIAWTPKGDEVWTAAQTDGAGRDLVALNRAGKQRTVLAMPGRLSVHDINARGEALLSVDQGHREIMAGTHGSSGERNLTWCDWSFLTDISADGSTIAFVEQGAAARANTGTIYIRRVDGSPAIHLGDGDGRSISPDGRWVAAMSGQPDHIDLLPVGAGEPRSVPIRGLEMMVWWWWFPDGKRLLVWGNEPERGNRMFEVAIEGDGSLRPIGSEGTKLPVAISPDGKEVAATGPDERLMIYAVDNSAEPREVPGSLRNDQSMLWGPDHDLYVHQFGRVRTTIDRIDLRSGKREVWHEIRPADPAGVMNIQPAMLSANRRSYAYSYRRFLSELFVVSGLL
jgi:hypothetical protein